MIYLDYNATTPLRPNVRSAMEAVADLPLNPSSVHAAGREARRLMEDARATIAEAFSAFPNEVLFTASATEANNMVLRGFAPTHRIIHSAIEHPSISKLGSQLGAAVIPVDAQGVVDLAALHSMLTALPSGQPALISVMLANNETGVIQPISDIAALARAHGALLHCDAVQAVGKIPMDWGLLGADMLSICAHKAGGPVGAAALLIRNDLPIKPLLVGGSQELGRRAGTVNVPALVGFGAMMREVASCPEAAQWALWRTQLEADLRTAAPEAVIFSADAPRLPNTLCVAMPNVSSETQMMAFDLAGFAISAGSACSSGKVEPSPVLRAMGVDDATARTAMRISWGWATQETEIQAFAESWKTAWLRLGKRV